MMKEPHNMASHFLNPAFSICLLYYGIMIGLEKNISFYEDNLELLRIKISELRDDVEFREMYSGSQSHNAKNVMGRIDISKKIFTP